MKVVRAGATCLPRATGIARFPAIAWSILDEEAG